MKIKPTIAIAEQVLMYINGSDYANSAPVYAENLNGDLFLIGTKEKHFTVADLREMATYVAKTKARTK